MEQTCRTCERDFDGPDSHVGYNLCPSCDSEQLSRRFKHFESRRSLCPGEIEYLAELQQREIERLQEIVGAIEELRSEEGDSVTIISPNANFNDQPNEAIEVCGDWTNWLDKRFTGETLREALQAAVKAKAAAEAAREESDG